VIFINAKRQLEKELFKATINFVIADVISRQQPHLLQKKKKSSFIEKWEQNRKSTKSAFKLATDLANEVGVIDVEKIKLAAAKKAKKILGRKTFGAPIYHKILGCNKTL